ncbi:MAG TPA: SPOR domain-containing protein [Thermoanaerobaculia bacterium]|nr:SPOR domain-containing protein [Thermoanaerobaculia bacterium]
MSNSHEPSYYEIALTNRQVVVAFVILLVCLLSAFFSGVWVGKSGAEPAGEQVVRAAPPPPEPTEGASLEELEFFDQPGGRPSPPASPSPAAETPDGETTLREDLEGPDADDPAPPPPSPSPTVSPSPRPVPPSPSPAPREERAEGRSEEIVQPRPLPETERRAEAGREPAAGSVVIQVFASPEQAEARRIRDRLSRGGQKAYLSPVTVDGRTMYRVRIGPFGTREDAQDVAETVRKTYKLDTWVTQ